MEIITSELTVIGGGMAGMTAAIAAARKGLRVTLVNNRPVLGGNHSSELRVHYNGSSHSISYYAREAGLSDEIKLEIFKYNPRYNTKDDYELTDMALLEMVRREPHITLFSNTEAYDVSMDNGNIMAVYGRQLRTEKEYLFKSPLFVDASGDGTIAHAAGALYTVGRESKDAYDESLAVDEADHKVMGSCILFKVGRENKKIPYVKPPFAYDYHKDDILKWFIRPETGRKVRENIDEIDGIWWLSYGGELDTIQDDNAITLELRKLVYGYWDYVKNSSQFDDVDNLYLKWVASMPGKRESRRFYGDYMLNQKDIENKVVFEDAVSVAGWSLDIHDVGGIYGHGRPSQFGFVPGLYQVPYRMMYSKNIHNLFLAGRITSATHVALGSIRVQQTLSAMAQAVGTAAALSIKHQVMPRNIRDKPYMKELQQVLQRDGQYILGMKEDVGYVEDAHITSSSVRLMENTKVTDYVTLDKNFCLVLPTTTETLESVDIKLKNKTEREQLLHVAVFGGEHVENYFPDYKVKEIHVSVDGNFDGWLTLPLQCSRSKDMKHYIILMKHEALNVYVSKERIIGAPTLIFDERSEHKIKRFIEKLPLNDEVSRCIGFRNITPSQHLYVAENVANGFSRPYGLPNVWVSEEEEHPWLEITFPLPKNIEEIQIIFNPQMETNNFSSPIRQLVKDYKIDIITRDNSICKVIRNNYQGLNRFIETYDNVTTIRFTFENTYGARYIEVFGVKVF